MREPAAFSGASRAASGQRVRNRSGAPSGIRSLRGRCAWEAGRAAEDGVARLYESRGLTIAARRWRGDGGEIDLVVREGAALVFVEVKQAETFAQAALRLDERQMARIYAAASAFLGGEPAGQATEVRFDVALVDGLGRVEIVEAAFGL
jgi:putative endonuclease